jgi:hypothetical protein
MKIPSSLTKSLAKIEEVANLNNIDVLIDYPVYNEIELIPIITDNMVAAVHLNDSKELVYIVFNDHVYAYAIKEGFDIDHIFDAFQERLFTEYSEENFCQYFIDHND